MEERNIFIYWIGKEYKLISILRNLIYLHSTSGVGYKVHLINENNILDYIKELPTYFSNLQPAHQADYVRVNVICDYGGIWLDSDTIVMESLDSLFDLLDKNDGFFIRENNEIMWNGVFGSKNNTPLMLEWKKQLVDTLNKKKHIIHWTEIGNTMLENIYRTNKQLYSNYEIFNGLDNMYPCNWDKCVKEFILEPYDNYKKLIKPFQPIVVLVNSVYKELETSSIDTILNGNHPINYFLNKSFNNLSLENYDFIEIGTSNFDTLIENADDSVKGISVDAVKYYIDKLPNRANVKKINVGISNKKSLLNVYYIPEDIIISSKLPDWFKGCNCINNFHPLHISHNVKHLCKIEPVQVIPSYELFYKNKVGSLKYLKIDTEGHDCIILNNLYTYLQYLPTTFLPKKILFESNEHTNINDVNHTIILYKSIGYKVASRGYDTVLTL
jgi:hypothetical protein